MPEWASKGWFHFRLEHDANSTRFFWSPNRLTWRVQSRGGEIMEMGDAIVMPFPGPAGEGTDDDRYFENGYLKTGHYRWNLVRRFDPAPDGGTPRNLVVYRWTKLGYTGRSYLSDVHYTPPANTNAERIKLDAFAHHLRLIWQDPIQFHSAYPPIWRSPPDYHLIRLDVASKPHDNIRSARQLVRRYHLAYDNHGHRSFLRHFQIEGRCASPVFEVGEALPATDCPRLPATTLRYSEVQANGIRSSIVVIPSPLLRPGRKALNVIPLDVNADSLPDLIETDPQYTSAPSRGEIADRYGFARPEPSAPGLPNRLLLLDNGTWHVPHQITGMPWHFSRVGYSVTGDFTSTGETGLWWYIEGFGPYTAVPRLGSGGWRWESAIHESRVFLTSGPSGYLKLFGDINGDGFQDLVNYPDEEASGYYGPWGAKGRPTNWKTNAQIGTWIAQRTDDGALSWKANHSCMGPSVSNMEEGNWPDGTRSIHLADMNSDSLADIVAISPTSVRYWPSDGRGNFTACRGVGCKCTTSTTSAVAVSMIPSGRGPNPSSRNLLLADLNGDGYADLVSWDRAHLRVAYNNDGWFFREPIIIDAAGLGTNWSSNFDDGGVAVAVADMNGNGINDLVITSGASMVSLDLHRKIVAPDAYAPRPDLLTEIDNGYGARTQIAYESTADIYRSSIYTSNAWPEPMPQIMHVVRRITTNTDVPAAKPESTYYTYHDPAWDGWERRLRGFRKVTVYRGGAPQVTTERTYFIPSCPDRFCGSTDDTFQRLRAVSGYPLVSETRDYDSRYLSTVSYSYDVMDIMQGLDGRWVRTAYSTQIDTRLYDTKDWNPVDATASQVISSKGRLPVSIWTGRVPIRARNNVLLRTTTQTDGYGNLVKRIDRGRIRDNGDPIDDAVVTSVRMQPPRPDWRFLPERVRTEPFAARAGIPADRPRIVDFEYDEAGRLAAARAILTGTLPLDRHHEDPAAAVAPPPPGASYDTVTLLAGYHYDDFDNVVRVEAPAGSCSTVGYDHVYAQLPEAQAAYRDGCGTDAIIQRFSWDRGLERMLSVRQPTGAISTASYDGFGRIVEARSPDPLSGRPATEPTVTIRYLDQAGGPIQRIRVERRLAPGGTSIERRLGGRTYVSWIYRDGAGRTLLKLRQADPSAGDGGAWIASGLPRLSDGGLVTGVFEPWFYSGDPAIHPLTTPTTPFSKITLDSFGRPIEMWRPDGTLAGRMNYRPLNVQSEDTAGRWSSVRVDGLGRLKEERSRTEGGETMITIDYLVGGEPARIIQDRSPNLPLGISVKPTGIVRWMQYDSLGRMVLNAEPNTSTGFNADPALATGLKAWRYAYNWAGQLVGVSDARGCGWNNHYDRLGRGIAQDLSPCLRSQAAYSAPNLTNGSGTEIFNRYDTPEPGQLSDFGTSPQFLLGQLVSTRDRGAHTRFAYDGRGRLVGLARRLARPADAAAVWPGSQDLTLRYSQDWFRSALEYDDANRTTLITTGASAAELFDDQGKSEIIFSYSGRGFLYRIHGSYGTLQSGATYDALGRQLRVRLGDAASTLLTTTYTPGGSLATFKATRMRPSLWSQGAQGYSPPGPSEPPNTQTILEDLTYHVDSADQVTGIDDLRPPTAWPPGAKPVSRFFKYDLLSRLAGVYYRYGTGVDAFVAAPSLPTAIPRSSIGQRPKFQTFAFDGFGNSRETTDDAAALFDRSIGSIKRGSLEAGPNQIVSAANGEIEAQHDAGGNLVSLSVRRSGCADSAGRCTHRFVYDWDEAGLLARARRWDYTAVPPGEPSYPALPTNAPIADLRYRYDGSGYRMLRSAVGPGNAVKHSAWPLALLRLEGAGYGEASAAYARSGATEEIVLPGTGHVLHRPGQPGASPRHVLLHIQDHLGSTSSVVDKATGELTERLSYLPYGSSESEYRPPRWAGLAAHERFTGKEEDTEIGLTYFGVRYYFPILGQWISPDPLTVHGLGLPDLNPYSYVSGKVTQLVDPNGMQACKGAEQCLLPGFSIGFGGQGGPTGSAGAGAADQGPVGPGPGVFRGLAASPSPATAPANSGWFTPAAVGFGSSESNREFHSVLATAMLATNLPGFAAMAYRDPEQTFWDVVNPFANLVGSVLGGNFSDVHGPVVPHRDPVDWEMSVGFVKLFPMPNAGAAAAGALPSSQVNIINTKFNRSPFEFPRSYHVRYRPAGTMCATCQVEAATQGGHAAPAVQIGGLVDLGEITHAEGIAIARNPANYVPQCAGCNRAQGSYFMGNVPGTWPPPNPTTNVIQYMKSLGLWR
jgi:RHS repeat-associated protein